MTIAMTLNTSMDVNPVVPTLWEALLGLGVLLALPLLMLLIAVWAVVAVLRSRALSITAKAVLLLLTFVVPVIGPILTLVLCIQARRELQRFGRAVSAY